MLAIRRGSFPALAVMAGAVMLTGTVTAHASASAAPAAGTWHLAIEVPGTSALVSASIDAVACPSAGNCVAGGYYLDRSRHHQALLVAEKAGTWGRAIEVPGTAALNTGGLAQVASISCPSPGNCVANGEFTGTGHAGFFVVSEIGGQWGQARGFLGGTGVTDHGFLSVNSLSCPSPGNCATGGNYRTASGHYQAFALDEVNGQWGQPLRLAGAGLRASRYAELGAINCSSAGNCTATGIDIPDSFYQLFAVSEQNGQWGQATVIAPSSQLGADVGPNIDSMSCASPGNCAVGGSYEYLVQDTVYNQPFVISETAGQWGQAMDVPGLTRPPKGGSGETDSVSCVPPRTCTAAGSYPGEAGSQHAFIVTEASGKWGQVLTLPDTAALGGDHPIGIVSVSCTSLGACAAGGDYFSHKRERAFVITETGGQWGKALPVPGLAKLSAGADATVNSVSCSSAGYCTAVGSYTGHSGNSRAFVVSET
jgi:hypothetical protein